MMASQSRKLEVVIAGDASGAKKAFDTVDKESSGLGSKLKSSLGGAGIAIAGAAVAGVAGLTVALKGAYDAGLESMKIGRETERVLSTTGAAAWTTADKVGDLATKISNLTGVDDELIQSGANLLLTFTNVRNAAGKGNDVFDQATGLALDMSKALGTDLKGATVQLGKALNDPIKGITALSRSGVSFTEQQKDQIKQMVKSGDLLGAQKMILKELSKEFGGAAAAAASPFDRLKVTLGNFQEQIGGYLIPVVEAAADWLGKFLPAAIETVAPVIDEIKGGIVAFVEAFKAGDGDITSAGFPGFLERVAGIARDVFDFLKQKWDEFYPKFIDGMKKVGDAMADAWGWLLDHKEVLYGAIAGVAGGLLILAAAATAAAIAEAAAAAVPILIVAALGALVGALIWAYNNWQWLHDAIDTSVTWLQQNVPPAWQAVQDAIAAVVDWLTNTAWPAIKAVYDFIVAAGESLVGFVQAHWGQIAAIVSSVVDFISGTINNGWQVIYNIFDFFQNLLKGNWSDAWHNILNVVGGVWDQIKNLVSNGWDVLKNGFLIFGGFIKDNAYHMWDGIVAGFKAAINTVISGWNGLHIPLPKVDLGPLGSFGGGQIDFPDIPKLHSGGVYRAPTPGGEGLALLRDGETVLTPGQRSGATVVQHFHIAGSVLLERDLLRITDQASRQGFRGSWATV